MAALCNNPALHQEPRNQPVRVIIRSESESIYDWIERTDRFKSYEPSELMSEPALEDLDEILEASVYITDKDDDDDELDMDD